MTVRHALLATAACLALGAGVQAADEGPYLAAAEVPDGLAILPPPPGPGSAAARADQAVFDATRKLRGSVRWRIAADDVSNGPLERYACALDLQLTPASAPLLAHLLDRAGTGALVDPVKSHYQARRPFIGTDAPICEAKTAHLLGNGDYPSGHAANGWLEALILARLAPDHASAILARGRAYGESRVICGSHSVSAVIAGWMAGSVMFAALDARPAFRHDLDAAARELGRLKATAPRPDSGHCAAEQAVLGHRPW